MGRGESKRKEGKTGDPLVTSQCEAVLANKKTKVLEDTHAEFVSFVGNTTDDCFGGGGHLDAHLAESSLGAGSVEQVECLGSVGPI